FGLQHGLLFADRDRRRHVLGDDVLAQPGTPTLLGAGADRQLLLGAGHRLVGLGAADVVADRPAGGVDRAGVVAAVVVEAGVVPGGPLLGVAQLAVGLDARRVLALVLAVGDADVAARRGRALERHEV